MDPPNKSYIRSLVSMEMGDIKQRGDHVASGFLSQSAGEQYAERRTRREKRNLVMCQHIARRR